MAFGFLPRLPDSFPRLPDSLSSPLFFPFPPSFPMIDLNKNVTLSKIANTEFICSGVRKREANTATIKVKRNTPPIILVMSSGSDIRGVGGGGGGL